MVNTTSTSACCHTLRLKLSGYPAQELGRFSGRYNLVGYVNHQLYWLHETKEWAIYLSKDDNWIVGSTVALGTPRDINAWIYTPQTSCPEREEIWENLWNTEQKKFMELQNTEDIQVECENRELVTFYNGEMVDNDSWLLKMSQEEVESLIAASQSEQLCGRRPWTNVINHQELYPRGNSQGFSGLPYGSDPIPEGVR